MASPAYVGGIAADGAVKNSSAVNAATVIAGCVSRNDAIGNDFAQGFAPNSGPDVIFRRRLLADRPGCPVGDRETNQRRAIRQVGATNRARPHYLAGHL